MVLKERKEVLHLMVLEFVSVCNENMNFNLMVTLKCRQFSVWLTQNVNNSGMGDFVYAIDMRIPFSKQYRYIKNHFQLSVAILFGSSIALYCLLCAIFSSVPITPEIQYLQLMKYLAKSAQVPWTYFSIADQWI